MEKIFEIANYYLGDIVCCYKYNIASIEKIDNEIYKVEFVEYGDRNSQQIYVNLNSKKIYNKDNIILYSFDN